MRQTTPKLEAYVKRLRRRYHWPRSYALQYARSRYHLVTLVKVDRKATSTSDESL